MTFGDDYFPDFLSWGTVSSGVNVSFPGPATGYTFLMQGIDVYPGVQPNNGEFSIFDETANFTIYQLQQSQNFPGPFAWRGLIPLYAGHSFLASATVPFAFTVWGAYVPFYKGDYNPATGG